MHYEDILSWIRRRKIKNKKVENEANARKEEEEKRKEKGNVKAMSQLRRQGENLKKKTRRFGRVLSLAHLGIYLCFAIISTLGYLFMLFII